MHDEHDLADGQKVFLHAIDANWLIGIRAQIVRATHLTFSNKWNPLAAPLAILTIPTTLGSSLRGSQTALFG